MSANDVVKEISGLSADEIALQYSKDKLHTFYIALFGITPRGSNKKIDLAYKLRNFIESDERTRDLCKLLN